MRQQIIDLMVQKELEEDCLIEMLDYVIDLFEKVTDEESAHSSREIALKEGLFVGYTSGAAIQAVKQLAKEKLFNKESNVVMIFCDHGSRYMSKIYSDKWMYDQGFYNSEKTELEKPIEYIK